MGKKSLIVFPKKEIEFSTVKIYVIFYANYWQQVDALRHPRKKKRINCDLIKKHLIYKYAANDEHMNFY
jgi:hypothetical protein